MAYWESCLDELRIPKNGYLALIMDWARSMGCSNDHDFIASCHAFLDPEAQESSTNLSPNTLFYLPLFHFLDNRAHASPNLSNHDHDGSDRPHNANSLHNGSSSMATPTEDDASLSITANLQKLNSGKYYILILFIYGPASSVYNQDQLLDSFTEARDTFYADDTSTLVILRMLMG